MLCTAGSQLLAAFVVSPQLSLQPRVLTGKGHTYCGARFPTRDTTPAEVVTAQLQALSNSNLTRAFELFSRARRAVITEGGRAARRSHRLHGCCGS
eukprot:3695329-Prymnesium_polylepis.1